MSGKWVILQLDPDWPKEWASACPVCKAELTSCDTTPPRLTYLCENCGARWQIVPRNPSGLME